VEETASDVEKLLGELGRLPEARVRPFLIIVSGLPGTGKSYFCRRLSQRLEAVIVESDRLRRALFPAPGYSAAESARLFRAGHLLIERLLRGGIPVIFDATNLAQHYREKLYQRLKERQGDPGANSEADWAVYQRMRPRVEKILHRHYAVDTSRDITPVIDKIIREVSR
jgi:predicted kinase